MMLMENASCTRASSRKCLKGEQKRKIKSSAMRKNKLQGEMFINAMFRNQLVYFLK